MPIQPPRSPDQHSSSPTATLWNVGFAVLAFSILIATLMRTFADHDLWGHLRFGLDMIKPRSVIQADPYSYLTAGQRWINHEWLAEVSFGAAWMGAGAAGLVALKVCIGLLTFAVLFLVPMRSSHLNPMRASAVFLVGSFGILLFLNVVRPQMYTFLFFAMTLIALPRPKVVIMAGFGRCR